MSANNNWTDFWKTNPSGFSEVMKQSTRTFAEKLEAVMPLSKNDNVLDIGCGPGYLIDFLYSKVNHIHGMDVSEKYISIASDRFKLKNITLAVAEAGDYKSYAEAIKIQQINKIIILSVLQYFTSEEEVKKLIKCIAEIATKGMVCIIADVLPLNHRFLNDALSVLINSFKKLYLLSYIRFMAYVTFSDYKNLKGNGMLHLDKSFFLNLGEELGVEVEIMPSITLHPERYSILFKF